MNSYGSVSLVSQAIYRVIRYMNWINAPDAAADAAPDAAADAAPDAATDDAAPDAVADNHNS